MPSRLNIRLLLVNIIALAGATVSGYLTSHFYDVRSGMAGFKSFCNINSTVNCDVVAASPYAEFAFGLPLSSLGGGWFVALFIMSLIAHLPNWRREALRISFALSLVGTLIGLFYAGIMVVKLKALCLLCFGIDGLNILGLALLFSLKPEKISEGKWDRSKWKVLIPLVVAAFVLSTYGFTFLDKYKLNSSETAERAQALINSAPLPVTTGDIHPSIGPKNAPVTIVEFSDFRCPFCKLGASLVNSLYHRYPGKIRIEFRNFPIDPSCNSIVNHEGHPGSCEAAKVALCAYKVGKFEEVYQELFERQGSLDIGVPKEIALEKGLDPKMLEKCMNSPETNKVISEDIQEGITLEINATPTFFINGHRMDVVHPVDSWNRIVEHFIKVSPSTGSNKIK